MDFDKKEFRVRKCLYVCWVMRWGYIDPLFSLGSELSNRMWGDRYCGCFKKFDDRVLLFFPLIIQQDSPSHCLCYFCGKLCGISLSRNQSEKSHGIIPVGCNKIATKIYLLLNWSYTKLGLYIKFLIASTYQLRKRDTV